MSTPSLSLLDLVPTYQTQRPGESLAGSVELAQLAERFGFKRVWYAEHHNFRAIASAAPAIIIAHVAAHTSTIQVGSGGVMLPNHVPYMIAEQFGTLAELYPSRIDLGVGRAPGTDGKTLAQALRRPPEAAGNFESDVTQLRAFLSDTSPIPGIQAFPGAGTNVPIYILGSSLYGAGVAARLGLPFGFASHFAPAALHHAIAHYREHFVPSTSTPDPYVIATVNVIAVPDSETARHRHQQVVRQWIRIMNPAAAQLDDAQIDAIISSGMVQPLMDMLRYTAVGNPQEVRDYLQKFAADTGADELMLCLRAVKHQDAKESLMLIGS